MGCNKSREGDEIGLSSQMEKAHKMNAEDIEKVSIKMAESAIKQFDADKSGQLDEKEVAKVTRQMAE